MWRASMRWLRLHLRIRRQLADVCSAADDEHVAPGVQISKEVSTTD